MDDIEDYPEWFYGSLNMISIRNQMQREASGDVKLKKEDVQSNASTKKITTLFNAQMSKGDARLAEGHAKLRKKFPGLMK